MQTITVEIPLDVAVKAIFAIEEMCRAELENAKTANTNGNCDLSKHMVKNISIANELVERLKNVAFGG